MCRALYGLPAPPLLVYPVSFPNERCIQLGTLNLADIEGWNVAETEGWKVANTIFLRDGKLATLFLEGWKVADKTY